MKHSYLIVPISALIAFLSFSGSSSGPAADGRGDNTGRRSAALTCGATGCHGSGSPDITLNASLIDKSTGEPITGGYVPGRAYEVLIEATNDLNTFNRFGFQAVMVNSGNAQAGDFVSSTLSPDYQISTSAGVKIVEHRRTLVAATKDDINMSFDWEAPSSGTGAVTLWAIVNIVNGNRMSDGADRSNMPFSITFNEEVTSAVQSIAHRDAEPRLFPNPAHGLVQLDLEQPLSGSYSVVVYQLTGAVVHREQWIPHASGSLRINTSGWQKGMYYIQLAHEAGGYKSVQLLMVN